MRIIAGILLIAVSFIATIYFKSYSGIIISNPFLWYIFFVLLGLFGVLLLSSSLKKTKKSIIQIQNRELEKLKANSDKIVLDFDLCEFRSGSYSHQAEDENMSAIGLVAPASLSLIVDKPITENVIQLSLIYKYTISGMIEKFISQSFPFDETTLKYHVLNNNIILYIDRFNRNRYFFELIR
jgi:hypothetical protein